MTRSLPLPLFEWKIFISATVKNYSYNILNLKYLQATLQYMTRSLVLPRVGPLSIFE